MPAPFTVFINERAFLVPAGARVRDGLQTAVPDLVEPCQRGEAFVTDGRGLPLPLDAPLTAGTILRVARSGRRGPADA